VRILDRERYWSFLKAYLICYVSLVGLYIVIDAFANIDEFYKRADGAHVFGVMARFYVVRQSLFFDQLCGVIGMMAAVFTVTWMQRNNEQLAVLAAGVSTHRAIRPVLVSSVIVSLIAVGNQELIMPRYAEELAKSHDDDGTQTVHVSGRYDDQRILIKGIDADRATRTIFPCYVTIPFQVFGTIRYIKGPQATYIPPDHPTAPLKGGWLIRGATVTPSLEDELLSKVRKLLWRVDDLSGFPPAYVPPFKSQTKPGSSPPPGSPEVPHVIPLTPHSEIPYLASQPPLPMCVNPFVLVTYMLLDRKVDLSRGDYFLHSSLTFKAVARKSTWYQFAPTRELLQGLTDPSAEGSEHTDISKFLQLRLLRPFLGLTLLFMSLPLVLGGYGRNTFINLGMALGNSAIFYGALFVCQYAVPSPSFAAWLPQIVFGTIAAWRWGQIRT
jgi:lipopolysaccharide export LptBFGC system permease protein LptF